MSESDSTDEDASAPAAQSGRGTRGDERGSGPARVGRKRPTSASEDLFWNDEATCPYCQARVGGGSGSVQEHMRQRGCRPVGHGACSDCLNDGCETAEVGPCHHPLCPMCMGHLCDDTPAKVALVPSCPVCNGPVRAGVLRRFMTRMLSAPADFAAEYWRTWSEMVRPVEAADEAFSPVRDLRAALDAVISLESLATNPAAPRQAAHFSPGGLVPQTLGQLHRAIDGIVPILLEFSPNPADPGPLPSGQDEPQGHDERQRFLRALATRHLLCSAAAGSRALAILSGLLRAWAGRTHGWPNPTSDTKAAVAEILLDMADLCWSVFPDAAARSPWKLTRTSDPPPVPALSWSDLQHAGALFAQLHPHREPPALADALGRYPDPAPEPAPAPTPAMPGLDLPPVAAPFAPHDLPAGAHGWRAWADGPTDAAATAAAAGPAEVATRAQSPMASDRPLGWAVGPFGASAVHGAFAPVWTPDGGPVLVELGSVDEPLRVLRGPQALASGGDALRVLAVDVASNAASMDALDQAEAWASDQLHVRLPELGLGLLHLAPLAFARAGGRRARRPYDVQLDVHAPPLVETLVRMDADGAVVTGADAWESLQAGWSIVCVVAIDGVWARPPHAGLVLSAARILIARRPREPVPFSFPVRSLPASDDGA